MPYLLGVSADLDVDLHRRVADVEPAYDEGSRYQAPRLHWFGVEGCQSRQDRDLPPKRAIRHYPLGPPVIGHEQVSLALAAHGVGSFQPVQSASCSAVSRALS